jgi:hypothetical protein
MRHIVREASGAGQKRRILDPADLAPMLLTGGGPNRKRDEPVGRL